jgi:hypothetical protein
MKASDFVGTKIGKLKILEVYDRDAYNVARFKALCDCGNIRIAHKSGILKNPSCTRCEKTKEELQKQFMEKVSVDEKGCWIWQGYKNFYGYGRMYSIEKQREIFATRYSFELFDEPAPDHLCVCHSCDNVKCVNPEHLWLGTVRQNNHDCLNKGRNKNGQKTVSDNNALIIRDICKDLTFGEKAIKYRELAKEYRTSPLVIKRIVRYETYKHLP